MKAHTELQQRILALAAEVGSLETRCESKLVAVPLNFSDLLERNRELEEEILDRRQEVFDLRAEAKEIDEKDEEIAALKSQVEDLEFEKSELEAENESYQAHVEQLEGLLDAGSPLASAALDLIQEIEKALGPERIVEDDLTLFKIYRAIDDVRDTLSEKNSRNLADEYRRLTTLQRECKADNFVQQLLAQSCGV